MVESIAKTLGAGSGIDVSALVTSLIDAQFSVKTKQIETKGEALTAQISSVSQLRSAISGFSTALSSLVKGGTLATQPTSSNTAIVKASVRPGSQVTTLSNAIEVRALASAQVAASTTPIAAGTELGTGSLKIQFGSYDANGTFTADATDIPAIDITDPAQSTLTAIAAKINATPAAGLTASIITDGSGERIVLKGANGAARAFTITATGSTALADTLGVAEGSPKIATAAADARVAIDGVEVRRATNTIDDLVPGVRLDLQSAVPGTRVSLGVAPATDALKQAVNDIVATYNEVHKLVQEATDPVTGPLARDPAAQDMKRQLRSLTLVNLTNATDGSPKTLAEIGVGTNRDGTLSVDSTRLTKALSTFPAAVETMFTDRGVGASGRGIAAAFASISSTITGRVSGLGASETRYTKAQTTLSTEKAKLADAQEKAKARMTQQYATMESRVSAYKATQSFMTNQIEAWNKN